MASQASAGLPNRQATPIAAEASLLLLAHVDPLAWPGATRPRARAAPRRTRGLERAQVVETFAHAERDHRQAELLGERDHHAAARRAVQLGHHEAGDRHHAREGLDLSARVLPRGRIEHQEDVVGRGRIDFSEHAHHLGELVHQRRLVVQAARGVDQQHVRALGLGLLGIEREACSVGAGRPLDHGASGRSPQMSSCSIAAARNCRPRPEPPSRRLSGTDGRACRSWWSCRCR